MANSHISEHPIPVDKIQAVFFDLDGTLLDSDNQAVQRLASRLRPVLGQRAKKVARWLLMKAETPGNALITLLDWLGLDEVLMGATDRLRRKRGLYPASEFQLIPGTLEMIFRLYNAGYRLGIVTTRGRYHIDHLLAQVPQLSQRIETSCGLQDTRRLKPHPSPILLAADRLGVSIEHCLMVGDTTVDVRSARRAGAWSVAVLCGFGERDELEKAGAHLILGNTADLSQVLLSKDPRRGMGEDQV